MAKTKKKRKCKTNPCTNKNHPSVEVMVVQAINDCGGKKGLSLTQIRDYIYRNFKVDKCNVLAYVMAYLRKASACKLIIQRQKKPGCLLSGRFSLSPKLKKCIQSISNSGRGGSGRRGVQKGGNKSCTWINTKITRKPLKQLISNQDSDKKRKTKVVSKHTGGKAKKMKSLASDTKRSKTPSKTKKLAPAGRAKRAADAKGSVKVSKSKVAKTK